MDRMLGIDGIELIGINNRNLGNVFITAILTIIINASITIIIYNLIIPLF